MSSPLAYFAYGFFTALVGVLVVTAIYWYFETHQSRKLSRLRRRYGSWHKRRREETTEQGPPNSGGTRRHGDGS